MSDYAKLPICQRWGWFSVRLDDDKQENEVPVYANSPEDAVSTFLGERFSCIDYPDYNPDCINVIVWQANNGTGHEYTYEITIEYEPSFSIVLLTDRTVEQKEESES